jgi:hypothetical protein
MELNILEERELFAIKSAIVIAELQEMQEKTKKLEAILLQDQYQNQDQDQDQDQQPVIKEELDLDIYIDNYVPSTDAHTLEPPRKRIKREN